MQATQRPKRILPWMVKRAYKITGLKPVKYYIVPQYDISGNAYCCGIGAVCSALGIAKEMGARRSAINKAFGVQYLLDWESGWDHGLCESPEDNTQGIRDGNAAAIACGLRKKVK